MDWMKMSGIGLDVAGDIYSTERGIHQADKQMDFQERMSSTSHQREVADLKAAGLNPILSAMGSGAPSASGAMAPVSNPAKGIMEKVNAARLTEEQLLTQRTVQNANNANAAKSKADKALSEGQKDLLKYTAKQLDSVANKNNADARYIRAQTPKQEFKGAGYKLLNKGIEHLKKKTGDLKEVPKRFRERSKSGKGIPLKPGNYTYQ